MTFENTLRQAIADKGWTQQQLASEVGVEQPTVQRWLKGSRKPDTPMIAKIAAALGLEPFDLVDLNEMKQLGLGPVTASSPVGAEIVSIFSVMGKRDRQALLDMSRTLQRRSSDD